MNVTLSDASDADLTTQPVAIDQLPTVTVATQRDWLVTDVIRAGGGHGFNSFALMTDEIARDVRAGQPRTVSAPVNLAGMRESGHLYFQSREQVRWEDFARAARAGVYDGDVTSLVFYGYGTAGGTFFEVVSDLVEFLASAGGIAGGVATAKSGWDRFGQHRREKIAQAWRSNGIVPAKIRVYAGSQRHHDPEIFGERFQLTAIEAAAVLNDLGYVRYEDGLWRTPN